jgi:nicotinamidase/pyrazinamidase
MTALLIVDVQNDFIPGGALPVPQGDSIIPLINSLQQTFNLIVATQDWHPVQHTSFASSHAGKKPFDIITLHGQEQVLWPDHCVQGSSGAMFHSALNTNKIEAIFRKGMDPEIDSYSGFYDNGHKKSTGLAGYLRERKVQRIFICGLAADYCVFYSAMDALQENFETYIIEDATRPIHKADFENAKRTLQAEGGQLIESKFLHRHL